jgi:hypothetical protein
MRDDFVEGDMQPDRQPSADAWHTRLVGSHDLQGREALQVTLRGDSCYVGHLPGHAVNPLTGADEPNGTSILDISDPANPVLRCHIPGGEGANCRAVQAIRSPRDGRDYLVRNHETAHEWAFEVFDVTDRARPSLVTRITSSPAGPLTLAHKSWWDQETGLFFASVGEVGFRPGCHLAIWDLADPRRPAFVSRHWIPGQHLSEPDPGARGLTLHHPIVDLANRRVYLGYPRGGHVVVVDISDISEPKTVLRFSIIPPFNRGPHTALPFLNVTCPNFAPGNGDVRDFIVFVNEANNWRPGNREIRAMLFVLDVTAWENPMTVSTFRVPDGDYPSRGLRFGPHQFAETKDGRLYSLQDNGNLVFLTYFSAGLRILDLSDPYLPREVGHYVPATTDRTRTRPSRFERDPELQGLNQTVIQSNDVDLDHRGLAYVTDRAGTGLHVVEYLPS